MVPWRRFLRRRAPASHDFHPARGSVAAIFLVAIHIQVAAAVEQAPPPGLPAGTVMVCTAEQSIGFRWVKGRWKSTDFIPNRYLIDKRAAGQALTRVCREFSPGAMFGPDKTIAVVLGCYAIRREGDDGAGGREQVCRERWRSAGSRWILDEVACDNFRFLPDGWFHRTSLHGDLAAGPPNDEKDPLSVSVGHCRLR